MKKRLQLIIASIAMIGLMISCSTSQDVASNRGIQKRKYNKGFFVSLNKKIGKTESAKSTPETVLTDNETSTTKNDGLVAVINNQKNNDSRLKSVETSTFIDEEAQFTINERVVEIDKKETPRQEKFKRRTLKKNYNTIGKVNSTHQNAASRSSESGIFLLILVIIALIIPPLAVLIYDGIDRPFWIDLILWLIGIGVGSAIFGFGVAYILGLIAAIYALLIIFEIV